MSPDGEVPLLDNENKTSARKRLQLPYNELPGTSSEQVREFLKRDPSAMQLGDLPPLFGNSAENYIAQNMLKQDSISKMKAQEKKHVVESFERQNSKLKITVGGYLVQKPSSLNLRFKKNQNEDLTDTQKDINT